MSVEPRRDRDMLFSEMLKHLVVVLLLICCIGPTRSYAQTFNSGSDGSDGAYTPSGPPGTIVVFDPSQFSGTNVRAGIFNFTTVSIPVGVTVRLSGTVLNGPVYWLAQGDVNIQGTIDLSGNNGQNGTSNPFLRVPSQPGAGGYIGGVGGNSTQVPAPGGGPGGGAAPPVCNDQGHPGSFSGNQFLIPLIGGSGGSGGNWCAPNFGPSGGAGGGALLIASSTKLTVGGAINAAGGNGGVVGVCGGGGSGGAIRLVSTTVTGAGTLNVGAGGPNCGYGVGGNGRIRLEAFAESYSGSTAGNVSISSPFPLLLPTAGVPSARVVSINGVVINPNPGTFPDITINTTSAVPVLIQTHNIQLTATINLTILDQNGVSDTVIPAPPIGNCDQDNFCTTTVNVIFPFGASRGLTKVTWTQ